MTAKVTKFKCYLFLGSEHLDYFLQSQERLKSVAFRSLYNMSLNGPVIFQLTQLSLIDFKLSDSPKGFERLVQFLAQQTKTLKRLCMGSDLPNFVYEFIFSKMTEIGTLCVYTCPKTRYYRIDWPSTEALIRW